MHIASALGVPTVAVFGATDPDATGPAGEFSRIVREPVDCSPCLLRECPIDHRCMTRVTPGRVAREALELLK
jgi:heptosyltransferase-2